MNTYVNPRSTMNTYVNSLFVMKYFLLFILTVLPTLAVANIEASTRTYVVNSMKSECEGYVEETVNQIYAAYEGDITIINETIFMVEQNDGEPTNYIWPGRGVVNLYELRDNLVNQRNRDVADFKSQNECPGFEEQILQVSIDAALAYYSEGWTLVLPKGWTHIDAREILKGNFAGGKNSLLNKSKNKVYSTFGMGKENTARKILDNPTDPSKWGLKF